MRKYGLMTHGKIISIGKHRTKKLKRINALIKDIERNGVMEGIGKPEALSGNLSGEFSRRIDDKNRLIYHMENGRLYIVHCRTHYGDK